MISGRTTSTGVAPRRGEISLVGLAWDHPRGYGPLEAAGAAFFNSRPASALSVRWEVQPLSGFESRSIADAARRYDLIVMDHPHTCHAIRERCLIPIGTLDDLYVGKTRQSYSFDGLQWAAPIDAASHVAAFAREAVPAALTTWDEVFAAARDGLRIAAPLAGVHSLMALLTLMASDGVDVERGLAVQSASDVESALAALRRLCDASSASGCSETGLDWNPIDALNAVADGRCDYLPMTFGYSQFVEKGVGFGCVPARAPDCSPRGVLGGAGLAVSACCEHPEEAIEFVKFLAGTHVQTNVWSRFGGQPAHRDAWNALANEHSFYRDARTAIEAAFVRPRDPSWNAFQHRAGLMIEDWLRSKRQDCRIVADQLSQLSTALLN